MPAHAEREDDLPHDEPALSVELANKASCASGAAFGFGFRRLTIRASSSSVTILPFVVWLTGAGTAPLVASSGRSSSVSLSAGVGRAGNWIGSRGASGLSLVFRRYVTLSRSV